MAKNKWVSFFLCFFFGFLGVHKFYEGKVLLGVVYLFTVGLFGIGVIVDLILLLFKPNPYFP
ncbi:MAG: NINE protein [Acutalibacteraceae bacterium]|jgi:TM2 domain-containing membrane protein YozV